MPWLASYYGTDGYIKNRGMFEDKDDALACLDQMKMRPEEYPDAHVRWVDREKILTRDDMEKLFEEYSGMWR